ncbi:hypothetical protein [Actinoallomurus vinaceus]
MACGMSAPAHAAVPQTAAGALASWHYVEFWGSQRDCIDAGQEYQREGWRYKCEYGYDDHVEAWGWVLSIWE